MATPGYSSRVSDFLIGRLENSLLPEVRAVGLGCDLEVASAKLAELAQTCRPQQLPGHRGRDGARGTGMRPTGTAPQCRVSVWRWPNVPLHQDDGEHGQQTAVGTSLGHLTSTGTIAVAPNCCSRLEPGLLAGLGLLSQRHDLQNLVFEGCPSKKVNDLKLLDGQGKEIDLQRLNLRILDPGTWLDDIDLLLGLDLLPYVPGPQL